MHVYRGDRTIAMAQSQDSSAAAKHRPISYEVYLTHMFVVFAWFDLFLNLGKHLPLFRSYFLVEILASGGGRPGRILIIRSH